MKLILINTEKLEVLYKKGVLKYFAKFTGKHLSQSLYCNKVSVVIKSLAGFQACNFIEKSLQHRCFPVNIAKFSKTSFFYRTRWLLLKNILILVKTTFQRTPLPQYFSKFRKISFV